MITAKLINLLTKYSANCDLVIEVVEEFFRSKTDPEYPEFTLYLKQLFEQVNNTIEILEYSEEDGKIQLLHQIIDDEISDYLENRDPNYYHRVGWELLKIAEDNCNDTRTLQNIQRLKQKFPVVICHLDAQKNRVVQILNPKKFINTVDDLTAINLVGKYINSNNLEAEIEAYYNEYPYDCYFITGSFKEFGKL